MGDIRIDYDQMSNLSQQMYALRDKLDATSKVDHTFASTDIGPDPNAAGAITDFYGAWKQAFSRAWDAMTTLGDDFNSAANAFFDTDAQLSAQMNDQNTQGRELGWESQKQAYDDYNKLKGKYNTVPVTDSQGNLVYGKDGKLETRQVPEWTQQQADQLNPGEKQTDWTTFGQNGTQIHTHLIYNGDKLVGTETTVSPSKDDPSSTASQFLGYKETTMYGANGGYTIDIHYADGSDQKIVVVAQPDGTATKSVYDGTGKLTNQYTGNVKNDQWNETWNSQTSNPNDNPQNPDNPNTDPNYYDYGTGH
ncbi:MAG: hypothetical protein JO362_13435 [Streptomycetaceae bacterium]|nr:hypothetical protein [Streptomycetaceae bacterium]